MYDLKNVKNRIQIKIQNVCLSFDETKHTHA